MRIALMVVLAFAGLWLVALRPKPAGDAAVPPASPPAVTSAPKKAEAAVAKANGTSARKEAAAEATGAPAAASKAAAPKPKPAPAPAQAGATAGPAATPGPGTARKRDEAVKVKRVLADLAAKKVVVLLFWDRRSADDREVYRAVEASERRGGKVSVRAAPIERLGDYAPIVKDLTIASSPSVVVIDESKRATVLSGLTVTAEVDAAVRRALARRCRSSIGAGAPVSGSDPVAVFGNAMTSRIESLPERIAAMRSMPNAIPPCGGAPKSSASSRKPNRACASSRSIPSSSSTRRWTSGRWMRIEPPPSSEPSQIRS
jgi:hypothetical protein